MRVLEEEAVARQRHWAWVEDSSGKPNWAYTLRVFLKAAFIATVNVHHYMGYIWIDSLGARIRGSKTDEDMKRAKDFMHMELNL